jgi:hypothetical protein
MAVATACNTIIGRGTKVRIFMMPSCDRFVPEHFDITTAAEALKGAETISIVATTNSLTYLASENVPIYLLFGDEDGFTNLVKVINDIAPGDTSLVVAPLARTVAAGSVAPIPVLLQARESASLTPQDEQVDILTFDSDGYKDQKTTMLGDMLNASGYYSPLDAGWKTAELSRLLFKECYVELELPNPNESIYEKGQVIYGWAGVQGVPIEAGSPNDIIKSNLEFMFRGQRYSVDPVAIGA